MKKFPSISVHQLFSHRRFTMIFSLISAFIFWLIITLNQNPIRTATFGNVEIRLEMQGSAAGTMGLDIISEDYPKTATVTVEGPNYIVSALKAGDIVAQADLSDVTEAGEYTLVLKGEKQNGTSGYTITSVSPATIRVNFGYVDTREFPVSAKADGISAVTGLVADEAVVSSAGDNTVTVSGERSRIEKIDKVVAVVSDTETLSASKTYDATIELYDENGNVLDKNGLTLSGEKVKVTVPICRKKELTVVPTFSGEPVEGAGLRLLAGLSHYSVTVIGPPTTVDEMTELPLSKIDFSEISPSNHEFEASFILPDGVRVLNNIENVTVSMDMTGYGTQTFTVGANQIQFTNLSAGLTAQTSPVRNVVFCGRRSAVEAISSDDLYAEVDLSGKTAGDYSVTITVKCRRGLTVWQVGTSHITVTVH